MLTVVNVRPSFRIDGRIRAIPGRNPRRNRISRPAGILDGEIDLATKTQIAASVPPFVPPNAPLSSSARSKRHSPSSPGRPRSRSIKFIDPPLLNDTRASAASSDRFQHSLRCQGDLGRDILTPLAVRSSPGPVKRRSRRLKSRLDGGLNGPLAINLQMSTLSLRPVKTGLIHSSLFFPDRRPARCAT